MSTLTPNYNLIKPELTDSIPLTIGNDLGINFAIIDSAMNGNRTDLDIIRKAVFDTGTVNNIVVDTAGTFDLTKNGNILTVIPLFTNTNATVNISVDGQANKLIKKADDTGTMVALEIGDLKKNVPSQLVWDSVNDFFIFAPKGGSNIKSIQRGISSTTSTSLNVTISPVDLTKSVVVNSITQGNTSVSAYDQILTLGKLTLSNRLVLQKTTTSAVNVNTDWQIVEFDNVKSVQHGELSFSAINNQITVSPVIPEKSLLFVTFRSVYSNTEYRIGHIFYELTNSTTITIKQYTVSSKVAYYYLVEFN